jgi:molecular chaperone DnaK
MLVHSTEKAMAEHGSKLGAGDRSAIERALSELKTAISGDDATQIEAKGRALAQTSTKLGEAAYKASSDQQGGGSGGQAPPPGSAADDQVVDADFEEVDEEQRRRQG